MNKNSNIYQISYASILVIAVGAILALVSMALKDRQDMNIADDTRKQILSSIRVQAPEGVTIEDTFNKYITDELLVDIQGNITEKGKGVAFGVDMKNFVKEKDATNKKYPVFVAKANDGTDRMSRCKFRFLPAHRGRNYMPDSDTPPCAYMTRLTKQTLFSITGSSILTRSSSIGSSLKAKRGTNLVLRR